MKYALVSCILLVVLASCNPCGDLGGSMSKFRVVNFASTPFQLAEYNAVTGGYVLDPVEEDVLIEQELAVQLIAEIERFSAEAKRIFAFELIRPAHACSPVPPTSEELVTAIQIMADQDFQPGYEAGADLSSLFDVLSVDDGLGLELERKPLQAYLLTKPTGPAELTLVLREFPDETSTFQFVIEYWQAGEVDYVRVELPAVTLIGTPAR